VDGQRAFLVRKGIDRDNAKVLQASDMGAATAIGGQLTETDFPSTFAQRGQARQIVADPMLDALLNSQGIDILRGIPGHELNATFTWPVMCLDGHPAQSLDEVTDQMTGGVHACVEPATVFIDPYDCHAESYRQVDEMDDPLGVLNHSQYLAFANPACIRRLSTALWVKQGGTQDHGKLVLVRDAFQDFHVGLELIAMEKKAQRHISGSIEFLVFIIESLQMRDNPAKHQRTVAL
jgi:hypothetical protein